MMPQFRERFPNFGNSSQTSGNNAVISGTHPKLWELIPNFGKQCRNFGNSSQTLGSNAAIFGRLKFSLERIKINLPVIAIFCCCCCSAAKGQQDNNTVKYDSLTRQNVYVYHYVDKRPNYKDDGAAFLIDFCKKFQDCFSKHDEEEPLQTKLSVQFVIDTTGHLIGERIYNKTADKLTAFEKAGLKTLNLMQNWTPGEHNGKPVNVIITEFIHIDFDHKQK
jgi:hypothetical protein